MIGLVMYIHVHVHVLIESVLYIYICIDTIQFLLIFLVLSLGKTLEEFSHRANIWKHCVNILQNSNNEYLILYGLNVIEVLLLLHIIHMYMYVYMPLRTFLWLNVQVPALELYPVESNLWSKYVPMIKDSLSMVSTVIKPLWWHYCYCYYLYSISV